MHGDALNDSTPAQPPALPAAVPRTGTIALPEAGVASLSDDDIDHLAERTARWWRRASRTGWTLFLSPPLLLVLFAKMTPWKLPGWAAAAAVWVPFASLFVALSGSLLIRRLVADECRALGYDAAASRRAVRAWDRARREFLPNFTHRQKKHALIRCLRDERAGRAAGLARLLARWLPWRRRDHDDGKSR